MFLSRFNCDPQRNRENTLMHWIKFIEIQQQTYIMLAWHASLTQPDLLTGDEPDSSGPLFREKSGPNSTH